MADIADVEQALVDIIDTLVYPNDDNNPSVFNIPCRIYRGWPDAAQLDLDLAAGVAHISIFEQAGFARIVPGYLDNTKEILRTPTITATVNGSAVTIGGVPAVGQLVGILINGRAYSYACQTGDTLAMVAAGLARLVEVDQGGTLTLENGTTEISGLTSEGSSTIFGSTIVFSTNHQIIARTGCYGQTQTLDRWMIQGFKVTIWAPSPIARDRICGYIDAHLARVKFIPLPDNQSGNLVWRNTNSDDVPQKEQMWRRELIYTVQFATSVLEDAPQVLWVINKNTVATYQPSVVVNPVVNINAAPPLIFPPQSSSPLIVSGSYNFSQNSPSAFWTINHNLNNFPIVTVQDSSGNIVEGDVDYVSLNTITITFSAAFSGVAHLTV